jgi:outer membrane protein TolC
MVESEKSVVAPRRRFTGPRGACLGVVIALLLTHLGLLAWSSPCLSFSAIEFDTVLQAALHHSYDLRITDLDVAISRSQLKEAKSIYFPLLGVRFNSQYSKNLANTASSQVTAVGDIVLSQNTFYQNSISLDASLDLYDFGAREDRVLVAVKDVPLKRAVYSQTVRDTKIATLQAYRDLLIITNDLAARQTLLPLHEDMALTTARLFDAGLASRVDVSDQTIKVVKIIDEIDNLKLKVSSSLQGLSFLTGEQYEAAGLSVAPLSNAANRKSDGFDVTACPEYHIYRLAREKKHAEMAALKKELFYPKFGLYSSYVLYGQDPVSYRAAYGDLRKRNFSIGLVATISFFDGFKNAAQIERTKLEMDRIRGEKEKKLSELTNRYQKLTEEAKAFEKTLVNQQAIFSRNEDNSLMTARLAGQKVIDRLEYLKRQIELVTQKHEIARADILKAAATMELNIFGEGGRIEMGK